MVVEFPKHLFNVSSHAAESNIRKLIAFKFICSPSNVISGRCGEEFPTV